MLQVSGYDFAKVLTLVALMGRAAEVIDDQKLRLCDLLKQSPIAPVDLRLVELAEQSWNPRAEHAITIPAGFLSERAGKIRFPDARRARDDRIRSCRDQAAGDELVNLRLLEAAGMPVVGVLDDGYF